MKAIYVIAALSAALFSLIAYTESAYIACNILDKRTVISIHNIDKGGRWSILTNNHSTFSIDQNGGSAQYSFTPSQFPLIITYQRYSWQVDKDCSIESIRN